MLVMRLPMLIQMPLLAPLAGIPVDAQLFRTLLRQCSNLLPSCHLRRAVHNLLDQIPIDHIPTIDEREGRTFAVCDVAGDSGRTAHTDGLRAFLADGIGLFCRVGGRSATGGKEAGVCIG